MIKMQCTIVIFAALVCVVTSATTWSASETKQCKQDPAMCQVYFANRFRQGLGGAPIKWNHPVGDGQVFGNLGSNGQGLYGQGGYKQDVFNDGRGQLEGQLSGTRVLSPNGDTSHVAGKLGWSNQDANAAVEVSKQIGGPTSYSATGAGKWNLDKNTQVSAGGSVSKTEHGKADVSLKAQIESKF